jgi:hypothetical protein
LLENPIDLLEPFRSHRRSIVSNERTKSKRILAESDSL